MFVCLSVCRLDYLITDLSILPLSLFLFFVRLFFFTCLLFSRYQLTSDCLYPLIPIFLVINFLYSTFYLLTYLCVHASACLSDWLTGFLPLIHLHL